MEDVSYLEHEFLKGQAMKMLKKALLSSFFMTGIFCNVTWANTALSQGVSGTGTIQSAVPMPYQVLDVSLGFDYASGADLGLRQIYRYHTDEDRPLCDDARQRNGYEDLGIFANTSVGQVCPEGTNGFSPNPRTRNNSSRISLTAGVAYGLTQFLEASLVFPYYQDNMNGDVYSGLGDVRASFKLNYPPYAHEPIFDLSYLLQFDLPTGNTQNGGFIRQTTSQTRLLDENEQNVLTEVNYDGTGVVDGVQAPGPDQTPHSGNGLVTLMKLLMTANFKDVPDMVPVRMHMNLGLGLSDVEHVNMFMAGGGLEFWMGKQVALFYSAETQVNVGHTNKHIPIFSYPIYNKIGLEGTVPHTRYKFTAGIGRVTNNKVEADYFQNYRQMDEKTGNEYQYNRYPNLAFFAGMNLGISLQEKDSDGDGVLDSKDACPAQAEDRDYFEDEDGCPEFDNDKDGVTDEADKCPEEQEDRDGFEDDDGCVDPDDDRDGILDADDKCPRDPEDKDQFEDEDGCPDLDNDGDGIEDRFDTKCPNTPEDKDGFEDKDGCPDLDNDEDGLLDDTDKCPNEAETINGIDDGDGCPDEIKEEGAEDPAPIEAQ